MKSQVRCRDVDYITTTSPKLLSLTVAAKVQPEVFEPPAHDALTRLLTCPTAANGPGAAGNGTASRGYTMPWLLTLRIHDGWVEAVAYRPAGRWIVTVVGGDPYFANPGHKATPGTVILRDAATSRAVYVLRSQRHLVGKVAFVGGGCLDGSASRDGLHLHQVATVRLVRTAPGRRGGPGDRDDGRRAVVGGPHY